MKLMKKVFFLVGLITTALQAEAKKLEFTTINDDLVTTTIDVKNVDKEDSVSINEALAGVFGEKRVTVILNKAGDTARVILIGARAIDEAITAKYTEIGEKYIISARNSKTEEGKEAETDPEGIKKDMDSVLMDVEDINFVHDVKEKFVSTHEALDALNFLKDNDINHRRLVYLLEAEKETSATGRKKAEAKTKKYFEIFETKES